MDEKHRDLLETHRGKFVNTIDVDKLFPILQDSDVLHTVDISEINNLPNRPAKANRLLDIIPSKGNFAFQSLCLALETTYPHLLTLMFLGCKTRAVTLTDSRSTSLTSDSEEDVLGPPQRSDSRSSETYTRRIPPYEYDYESCPVGNKSSGSNYPIENQNCLPIDFEPDIQSQLEHKSHHGNHRNYDWLKSQCEQAMNELQSLKHQQSDTMKRCDQAMKEADVYRQSYRMAVSQLQQKKDEIHIIKMRNSELAAENQKLEKEVENLQNLRDEDKLEMSELRKQQREVINESGSNEVLNKMCDSALDKYEAAKKDFDDLRGRYSDLVTAHGVCKNKLESSNEEIVRLRKQLEASCMERDAAVVERNGLKQQCTAAIRNWDQKLRECDEAKGALEKVTQQRDECMKDMNQALASHLRAKKDRDTALKEYSLVMSERDTVHKEIEQLQDKLGDAVKNFEQLKKEKASALDDVESLHREIKAALEERDKAIKERNDMYDKYSAMVTKGDHIGVTGGSNRDYNSLSDRHIEELYESEKVDKLELDNVTKETEALKKQIDKLKQELADAIQEAEIAKKRRDWAFGERDKIVQERDSIRTLGDKLRRERDRAVSNLAQSLRDFDEMKKEKSEASKDLKDIKEKYDALIEKEARKNQLNSVGHNNSRDSAIDTDMQEWETEILEVELTDIDSGNLGFDIVGGKDDPQFPNDSSIFVSQITKGSQADSKLRINDLVLKINNLDVTNVDRRAALHAAQSKSRSLHMLVRRRKAQTPRSWQPIHLNLPSGKDHGLQIEQGLFINAIDPNSAIGKDGMLTVGDRITMVNNRSVEGMSVKEFTKMFRECRDCFSIDVWRQTSPTNSPGCSPTPNIQTIMPNLCVPNLVTSPVVTTDKVGMRRQLWSPDTSDDSKNSNKNLKTSGSQTDSLDSPGTTPKHTKDSKLHDDHKSKVHILEMAKTNWGKLVGKHKNHDNSEHSKSDKSRNSVVPVDPVLVDISNKSPQRTGRKRELIESENSGTWPKCVRGMHVPNGTAIIPSPGRRKRPSIDTVINGPYDLVLGPANKLSPDRNVMLTRQIPEASIPSNSSKSTPFLNNQFRPSLENAFTDSDKYIQSRHQNARNPSRIPLIPTTTNSPPYINNSDGVNLRHCHEQERRWPHVPASQHTYDHRVNRPVSLNVKHPPPISPPYGVDRDNSSMSQSQFPVTSPTRTPQKSQNSHLSPSPSTPGSRGPYIPVYESTISMLKKPNKTSNQPVAVRNSVPSGKASDYRSDVNRPNCLEPGWCTSPSPSQISIPTEQRIFSPSSDLSLFPLTPRSSPYEPESANSTFPRKPPERRLILPSTPSVTTTRCGSVEIVSDRSSPASPVFLDYPRHNIPHSVSPTPIVRPRRKPMPGETRNIRIEKKSEPVGFKIGSSISGGIFVSSVTENSLAADSDLLIGDQLLEVCGINMRSATYDHAALVLMNCGNPLTMKVQYNPDKYSDMEDSGSSTGNISSTNSPDSPCKQMHLVSPNAVETSPHRMSIVSDGPQESPRYITLRKMNPHASLRVTVVGGNAVGILVDEVHPDSIAFGHDGLHRGDQILEYNGISFKEATAEEAVHELSKSCSTVRILAQYNPAKYSKIRNQPGDSFYVRSHFDRAAKSDGEMGIRKDSILHVENTIYGGRVGHWYASLIDEDGNKIKSGIVLSKDRLEEDMMLRRSLSESRSLHDSDELKGSTRRPGPRSVRSSFFRRKRHQRNNSKDSQDLGGSFSDASLNSDSVPVLDDFAIATYTRVERIEYGETRPVVLLAPLVEPLFNKLASESPDKYHISSTVAMHASQQVMEQGLSDGTYIEYWTNDNHFMCIRTKDVTEICNKRIHCLLNVTPAAVERLQRLKIYPIVIFARHKSYRQIREQRDVKFLPDKMGNKSCRELFEHYQKVEQDFHQLFSAIIQGGNLAEMCMQIKTVIDSEQKKAIWVPVSSLR